MSSSPGDHPAQAVRRAAWSPLLPLDPHPPVRPPGGAHPPGAADTTAPAPAQDTLQVIANADRWAQLTHALAEARVPLAVGDVDAMRQLAKLEQPVLDALTRWISTAGDPTASGPGRRDPLPAPGQR